MRVARSHAVAVTACGVVCVAGGQNAEGGALSSVEFFDLGGDDVGGGRWLQGPSLEEARFGAAAAVRGDVVYVAGGVSGQQCLTSVEQLSLTPLRREAPMTLLAPTLSSCCWSRAPALSNARAFATMFERDSILYVFGGLASGSGGRAVCPSRPDAGLGSCIWSAERLELDSSSWVREPLPPPKSGRLRSACALTRCGVLVLAGGGDVVESAIRPHVPRSPALRVPEPQPQCIVDGLHTLARDLTSVQGDVGLAWSRLPPLRVPRLGAGAAVSGDGIYVLGGCGAGGQALASIERWEPGATHWEVLPDMAVARNGAAIATARH